MSVSKVGTIAFQFKSDLMVKVSAFFNMITNNGYFSSKGSIVNGIAQVMNKESNLHDQGRPGKSRGPVQKYKHALNLGAK